MYDIVKGAAWLGDQDAIDIGPRGAVLRFYDCESLGCRSASCEESRQDLSAGRSSHEPRITRQGNCAAPPARRRPHRATRACCTMYRPR